MSDQMRIYTPSNTSPPESAKLTKKPGEDLKAFCKNYCPGITEDKMASMITKGEVLGKELLGASEDPEKWKTFINDKEKANPESAVHLIWLLTAQSAKQNNLFTSGAMRLGTKEPLTAEKLENFLKACGQGQAYSRISTHMKENLTKDDTQWGLDLRDMGLPSDKHTILFAKQPDGSFYVKIEEAGCPPFWKKGFATIKNFNEFVSHAIHYVQSRPVFAKLHSFINRTKDDIPQLASRKEHVPEDIKKMFKNTMKQLYGDTKIATDKYNEGKKYGISQMKEILKDGTMLTIYSADGEMAKLRMKNALDAYLGPASLHGYKGEVKGNEVLLPPLGS